MLTYTPNKAKNLISAGILPPGSAVSGSLYLSGCAYLKSIPEGLKVGGDLFLYGCTALKTLPTDLMVVGWLDITGCNSLQLPKGFPEGVKGVIYADESFFRYNKDHLLLMINCTWKMGNANCLNHKDTKQAYFKVLSEV